MAADSFWDSFFGPSASSVPVDAANPKPGVNSNTTGSDGGFWSKFNAGQLLDVGAKVFETKTKGDVGSDLAKAQQRQALAKAQSNALLTKWLPIAIVGVVIVVIVGYVFKGRH